MLNWIISTTLATLLLGPNASPVEKTAEMPAIQKVAQSLTQPSLPAAVPTQSEPVKTSPAPAEATNAVPQTSTPQTTTQTTRSRIKTISNVFTDTDVKAVIQEMATQSGVQIVADTSVKGMEINIEFKKDTVDSALEKLAYAAGLLWKKKGDIYLVSTCEPDAPLFTEFAETKVYTPHTQAAENLYALLTRKFILYAQLDKAANMISVTAPPKQMEAIWKALEAADAPRKQFVVEAMVTQMDDQYIKTAGFSWNWQYFSQGSDLSMTYATATSADLVTIKAMIQNNKAELRANPKVIASEGHEASITVGNENYFSLVGGTGNSQSVQYQRVNTGITLKFTGYVEADGVVNLHIQPEVSDAVTLVNGNPQTTVRKADTYLRVRFGETVALGGMIVGSTSVKNNKVPVLGDIPVVGNLFKSQTKEKDKSEVVILITPRMVQDMATVATAPDRQ